MSHGGPRASPAEEAPCRSESRLRGGSVGAPGVRAGESVGAMRSERGPPRLGPTPCRRQDVVHEEAAAPGPRAGGATIDEPLRARAILAPMRRRLLLAALLLCSCPDRGDEASDPVAAARHFLRAVQAGRCEAALERLTALSRRYLEETQRRNAHLIATGVFAQPVSICDERATPARFGSHSTNDLALVSSADGRAVVRTTIAVPKDGLPGFSCGTRDQLTELELLHEDGRWRIELRLPDPTPGFDDVQIGRYRLELPDPCDGPTCSVHAEGVLNASPERLLAAFEDLERWPSFWPGLKELHRLDAPPENGRALWRLVFATSLGERVEAVVVQPRCSKSRGGVGPISFSCGSHFTKYPLPGGVLQLTERGGGLSSRRAPSVGKGQTFVTWRFTFENIAWPAELRAGLMKPEGLKQLLDALEAEALEGADGGP